MITQTGQSAWRVKEIFGLDQRQSVLTSILGVSRPVGLSRVGQLSWRSVGAKNLQGCFVCQTSVSQRRVLPNMFDVIRLPTLPHQRPSRGFLVVEMDFCPSDYRSTVCNFRIGTRQCTAPE